MFNFIKFSLFLCVKIDKVIKLNSKKTETDLKDLFFILLIFYLTPTTLSPESTKDLLESFMLRKFSSLALSKEEFSCLVTSSGDLP